MWFEAILGLRINLDESELILVGCVENVEALVVELGCKVGTLPSSYLGLLSLWLPRMEWRRGFERDWQCGRDNISPKEGGSL